MSVLIEGRRVVTATDDVQAGVLVEGEQISLIGARPCCCAGEPGYGRFVRRARFGEPLQPGAPRVA